MQSSDLLTCCVCVCLSCPSTYSMSTRSLAYTYLPIQRVFLYLHAYIPFYKLTYLRFYSMYITIPNVSSSLLPTKLPIPCTYIYTYCDILPTYETYLPTYPPHFLAPVLPTNLMFYNYVSIPTLLWPMESCLATSPTHCTLVCLLWFFSFFTLVHIDWPSPPIDPAAYVLFCSTSQPL